MNGYFARRLAPGGEGMKLWPGGSDHHSSSRSRGYKGRSDNPRGGRGPSRRNPLSAPETEAEIAALAAQRRESQAVPLHDLETEPTESPERADQRKRKHHVSSKERATTAARGPISLTHVAFLLLGLALGAVLLISVQQLYTVLSRSKAEDKKPVVAVKPPPPPTPAPPAKAAPMATDPIAALRLMLKSAAQGDTTTAYAQWAIGPDDLATVRRGQEMTVADVVSKAKLVGPDLHAERAEYRMISQTGAEVRVGQYEKGICAQIFSLRKQGPYWKLYNVSTP